MTYGDRFRVEGEAIEGGMGLVYRAKDLQTGEQVALKVLTEARGTQILRFRQEAQMLADIAHPAIVRYLAHGTTPQGEQYMVMEWLEGETLEDRVARGRLRVSETLQIGRRVAEALAAAHKLGVVHRDIKPANVFLPQGDPSQAKVLDFGIARRLYDPRTSLNLTGVNAALGTPLYMAPEQARGANTVDSRADIFSLGCVLFECLAGQPPFAGDSPTAIMAKILLDESVDVSRQRPETPEPLVGLLRNMLAKEPEQRPAKADDVAVALRAISTQFLTRTTASDLSAIAPSNTPAPVSLVTTEEQRVMSAILLSRPFRGAEGVARTSDPGRTADLAGILADRLGNPALSDAELAELKAEIAPFGARLERLAGGSLVIAMSGEQGTPTDQACQAGRCALRLKAALPEAKLGISTIRADRTGRRALASVIDHAGQLLATTPAGSIHIDALTAHLLETRFEIAPRADGHFRLLFEKGLREAPRTLVGREVPCFGREREIDNLEGLWNEVCDEPVARAMLITAPAGGGKSRVRQEFCDRVQGLGRPFDLLVGRGDPMRDGAPLALIGLALRTAAGITGGEPLEVQRKRLTAHATRYVPAKESQRITVFLGEIASIPFADDGFLPLRAARQDPRLMADQMQMAWVDWLDAEVQHHPVLLVLEDLHWGDPASVNFVDAALRVLKDKPLMVVALARPEVDRRFMNLWSERGAQRINLGPLSPKQAQRMIEHVVGTLPPESVRWMVERAQGNPFYLEELLRVVIDGGKVGDDSQLPDTVLGMVQARFDIFGPDAKLVLRAGSVFGQTFHAEGVKALIEADRRQDVDRWLEIFSKKEILFSRPSAAKREYAFRHALLRQASYEMMPPDERRLGHLLAGRYLEKAGEREGIVLADHFERGEDNPRAIHWFKVAAQQALDADDLGGTLNRVERAANLGAADEDLYTLRTIEAQVQFWRGEFGLAEKAAQEALSSQHPLTRLRAMSSLFDALGPAGKYQEVARRLDEIADRPAEPELLNPWLDCMVNATAYLAQSGVQQGRERTLALLEESKDKLEPLLIGRVETLKAHLARAAGKPSQTVASFGWAAKHYESMGNRRAECETSANLAQALVETGQIEEAEACMRRQLEIARRLDLKAMVAGMLTNLVLVLAYRGSLDEARDMGQQALAMNSAQGSRYFLGSAEAYLSVTEHLAGNFEAAERFAAAAVVDWESLPTSKPFALALLSRALLMQGRASEALVHARAAHEWLKNKGPLDEGEATVRLAMAECLLQTGDKAGARTVLVEAAKWLMELANTLEEPPARQSFLTRRPDNRRILELCDELGRGVG
jgi:serine/threonine protein kinase/tetratricopeptide (TPR) repeat protein